MERLTTNQGEYIDERVARINTLSELARKKGVLVPTPGTPPELKPDGSLVEPGEPTAKGDEQD